MCPFCKEPVGAIKVALADGGIAHRRCCNLAARRRRIAAICDLLAVIAFTVVIGAVGGSTAALLVLIAGIYLHYRAQPAYWRS